MTTTTDEATLDEIKDKLHARILARTEYDPRTECWLWTGGRVDDSGFGMIRVFGRNWTVSRVAAWIYLGGFDLEDRGVRVSHACNRNCCCNYEHLEIKKTPADMRRLILETGGSGRN